MGTTHAFTRFGGQAATVELVEALRRGRRRLMIAGILATLLGMVAIIVPAVASVATAIFIGWILVIASAFQLADAFSVSHRRRRMLRVLLALLTLAAGLYLLLAPLEGTFTLTVMLAIWFAASGAARIVFGVAERGVPGAGLTTLNGLLSLALAVLITLELPASADWAIGLLVGVDLLFAGASLIALARSLRPLVRER